MVQTWRTTEVLKPTPGVDYINACCQFCDRVLEKIKPALSEKTGVAAAADDEIVIGQEDWGWYLEFQKNEIIYILSISYQDREEEGEEEENDGGVAYNFGVTIEALKIKKGFLFNRKIEAEKESREFAEQIKSVARRHNIEVSEE